MVEWSAIWVTVKLAAVTTVILLAIGTPFAWWLANHARASKAPLEALTAMPLVLPPTVLGFYLLILMSPNSTFGAWWLTVSGEALTFNFTGLVFASVIYSLPFMVQPLQSAFESLGKEPMEAAATLGARPFDTFRTVALPLCKRGFLTATVLTFAHTLGEFGVVLMVGGNIPGETRVISIAIYEHVETFNYAQAHALSIGLLVFSFFVLFFVYTVNKRAPIRFS
ncbi:MAG: molybdate ABC transporter permease subunit [Gammaproteobacteria bacterium]|nr:molybdate ABC transporter permease subunit [Gammaproteobacteria bacterium]